MPASLLLCASQQKNVVPYQFKLTNVKVYSIEEALYHAYSYWKESLDDVSSRPFADWVSNALGLPRVAKKISGADSADGLSARLINFLSVIDYFDEDELGELHAQLVEWENRLEWERLKDRGDQLNGAGQPAKAYPFYLRALAHDENARLLNNAGVCLMKLCKYREAAAYLERAHTARPDDAQITKNFIEALIYGRDFGRAKELLTEIEATGGAGDLSYLYGELCYEEGDIRGAAEHYQKATASGDDVFYIYRLTEIYVKLRYFDRAIETMNAAPVKDRFFLIKQAEIYAACGNVPAAIKCVEKALVTDKGGAKLWMTLAQLYRLNYDNTRAEMSIRMALDIEPDNEEALLESARIKKLSGKTREYQQILRSILQNFKKSYREIDREKII